MKNNYSWFQQKLHKFALSSKFMREVAFDFETSNFNYSKKDNNNKNVFITGLARSGTTILLNAIYKSNIFGSLTYSDMPFILAPKLSAKLFKNKTNLELKERAHGDGIKISFNSPEAFEEVFWNTFEDDDDYANKFRLYVSIILNKYEKNRYLSKNNQNIKRIDKIAKIFNYSKILIPFRDPLKHSFSLLSQHKKFIKDSKSDKFIGKYMKWIGHKEFGPNYIPVSKKNLKFKNCLDINHWVEQWVLTYKYLLLLYKDRPNVNFICYEKLCSSKQYWYEILKLLEISKVYDYEFSEPQKTFKLIIDENLLNNSTDLYQELSNLKLKF